MSRHWLRMINSAQRVVTLDAHRVFGHQNYEKILLDIQGISCLKAGQWSSFSYLDMAEFGIHKGWAKPLSILQRLRREQSPLGWLERESEDKAKLVFWCDLSIELIFDLEQDEDAVGFRETEIMVMSGGYCFMPR